MAALHKYDYIFAIVTIFTSLDAWNIGANDVANSFATSVSSRSLSLKQAMLLAAVCEFSGSVSVGDRVADTIRTRIISPVHYEGHPSVLLLAMMCAIVGSSVFLTFATRHGMPVSTTHSIIGGLVGSATASVGIDKVNWGWQGVSQVFSAWVIAPGIAGVLGAGLFLLTKWTVLRSDNAVRRAFYSIPFFSFITVGAIAMLIAWKGVGKDSLSEPYLIAAILAPAAGAVLIQGFFVMPYLWVRIVREDWTLRWWHMTQGPLILKRPAPPPTPPGFVKPQIRDFYQGHLTPEELAYVRASEMLMQSVQTPDNLPPGNDDDGSLPTSSTTSKGTTLGGGDDFLLPPPAMEGGTSTDRDGGQNQHSRRRRGGGGGGGNGPDRGEYECECSRGHRRNASDASTGTNLHLIPPKPPGSWHSWPVLAWRINRVLLRGLEQDVVALQGRNAVLRWDLEDMHSRATRFDNRAEYMYASLQILTAAAASFTHGANDVANAISPFATAYDVWHSGDVPAHVTVHVWILAAGAGAIVLGLATYGYHVMRTLGNRLTLISPSRGFCMELASAATILLATRLALPVSTTQCITGATVGVGLANGDWRCINPKIVAWIYLGWIITVPVTGLISGCLMAFALNAPSWESTP